MRADDILSQIDGALEDWTVSDDAMRSRPGPEASARPFASSGNVTMCTADAAGEWQEISGVTNVEIRLVADTTQFEQALEGFHEHIARVQAEQARRAQIAMDMFVHAFADAVAPAAEAAAKGIAELEQAFQQSQQCSRHGGSARTRDRPAWQSPYGPARRRR